MDMEETHHDGLIIKMVDLREDMKDLMHVCRGMVDAYYDLDVEAMFEMYATPIVTRGE